MKKPAKAAVTAGAAAVVAAAIVLGTNRPVSPKPESEWAVYWYVCGSDLESGHGAASEDISELISAPMPEGTEFVIETGGSMNWMNNRISEDSLCRFVYAGDNLETVSKLTQADMGSAQTLAEFLSYCVTEHPAKHAMLLLWDHGGGTLGGVSYDANYNMDSLSLPELTAALSAALTTEDGTVKKLDMIGFDACLMSTLDTMNACAPYASYMVASQQLEPVCGWNYSKVRDALSNPQDLTSEAFGRAICDSFYEGCEYLGLSEAATLAVTDLGKAQSLSEVYESMLLSLFDASLRSDESMASIRRNADSAENYGVNGKAIGYTDMVDILDFLCRDNQSASELMKNAISDTVIYQVTGESSADSCGISCYYPLDQNLRSIYQYGQASSASEDIILFYRYLLDHQLNDDILSYATKRGIAGDEILTERYQITEEDLTVTVPEDGGDITLNVDPEKASKMAGFKASISVSEDISDSQYHFTEIGERLCTMEDYEGGAFTFSREQKAAYLGNTLLATYISSVDENTIRYYSPVVIDGKDGFFLFSVGRTTDELKFLGYFAGQDHEEGLYNPETEEEMDKCYEDTGDKSFIGKRLHPLTDGLKIEALYLETESPENDPHAPGAVSAWKTAEPLIYKAGMEFSFLPVEYNAVSFLVTDECGREAISPSASVEKPKETEEPKAPVEKETEPETEKTTEAPTEPETTVRKTEARPAPTETVPETSPALPETSEPETEPTTEETAPPRPTYGGRGNASSGGGYSGGGGGGGGGSRTNPTTEPETTTPPETAPETEQESSSEPESVSKASDSTVEKSSESNREPEGEPEEPLAEETSATETSAEETSATETSAEETSATETSAEETSATETSAGY